MCSLFGGGFLSYGDNLEQAGRIQLPVQEKVSQFQEGNMKKTVKKENRSALEIGIENYKASLISKTPVLLSDDEVILAEGEQSPEESSKGEEGKNRKNPTSSLSPLSTRKLATQEVQSQEAIEAKKKTLTTLEKAEEKKLSSQNIDEAAKALNKVATQAQDNISAILGDADLANNLLIGATQGNQVFRLVPTSGVALTEIGNQFQVDIIEPGAPVMSLDDCIKTALAKNPDILAAVDAIRARSGDYIKVRSELLPHFGANNNSYQWIDPSINNKYGEPDSQVPINQLWQIKFGATQLLTDGGKAWANTAAAHFSEQIAYYELRQTIDRVIADVIDAFYETILNRSLVAATQESLALQANYLEDQKSRYEVGSVSRFDVLQAQVQLNNTKPDLINDQNKLRVSFFNLMQLMGIDYPQNSNGKVPFNIKGKLDYYPRKIHREESIYTALQRNPQLKAERHNILMMAKKVNAAVGNFLPTVKLNGGYEYLSADRSVTGPDGTSSYAKDIMNYVSGWFFGVEGDWPIFDGLANYGELKSSKANMMVAKANYDNQVRKVIFEVQQAISDVDRAEGIVDSQKANLTQAAEAFQLAQERVNSGAPKAVQLDVLNQQRALLVAQTTLLQAQYDYIAAIAKYDRALSLNTQYAEMFDDPMNKQEKARYKKWVVDNYLQPALPKQLRKEDLLPKSLVEKSQTIFQKVFSAHKEAQKEMSKQQKKAYTPLTNHKLTPNMGSK